MTAPTITESQLDAVVAGTYAALKEARRPDLADLVSFWPDDDGRWYMEPVDEVSDADYELMSKAVTVALGPSSHSARLDRAFCPEQETTP